MRSLKLLKTVIWSGLVLLLAPALLQSQDLGNYTFIDQNKQVQPFPRVPGKPGVLILWSVTNNQAKLALLKTNSVSRQLKSMGYSIGALEVSGALVSAHAWIKKSRLPYQLLFQGVDSPRLADSFQSLPQPVFLIVSSRGRVLERRFGYTLGDEYKLLELCENISRKQP